MIFIDTTVARRLFVCGGIDFAASSRCESAASAAESRARGYTAATISSSKRCKSLRWPERPACCISSDVITTVSSREGTT